MRKETQGLAGTAAVEPFSALLERHKLALLRDRTTTLQVNVGLICNQSCRHCHLEAGPGRGEIMSQSTMEEVIAYAGRGDFACIDVTGGAPEMVPDLGSLLEGLAPLTRRLMLRSNLTAIAEKKQYRLIDLCRRLGVTLVVSFASTNEVQADAQRGSGVWETSLSVLKDLNIRGYGRAGSGLELNLVTNPSGAYLPADQCQLEKKFRTDLQRRWGIEFNSLYTFSNAPLGRFRRWLARSGNLDAYLKKLADRFNAETVPGLMCRNLVSVSWDGFLFDCDFNQAAGLPLGREERHVANEEGPPPAGQPIAVGDHCYACTAGAGFT